MESRDDAVDRVRRAFAALRLQPGASVPEVRRRYRFLAQRWHPDRHAGDPRNQAEATAEMRRINDAYRVIVENQAAKSSAAADVAPTRRLSPQEIDALSKAIGSDGPVDWTLGSIGWVGSAIEGLLGIICAVWLVVRLATELPRGDFSVFREHPEIILLLVLLAVLVVRELLVRNRISDPATREPVP